LDLDLFSNSFDDVKPNAEIESTFVYLVYKHEGARHSRKPLGRRRGKQSKISNSSNI
jgi:hypothetical protein